ncbi:unnamed protein product [Caenorhabditis brenneri]
MSVRDKYRSTFNELQRAESIPEKISVFRRAWAWVIVASQKALARFGLIVIPIYLIVLSLWTFNDCGDIPVFLFSIGIGIFICTLYPPFYAYGKKKALEDRQDRINHQLEPLHEGELSTEEVNKFIPLRMHRICNMAFTFVLTMAPLLTYHTFNTFSSRDQMPVRDVRNEYDAAVRRVQRTDKLPPKVLFVLRAVSSCFGFCMSIFLITVGWINRKNCEEDKHIPYWLIVTGIVIFISALNFPFYLIGWRRARHSLAPQIPTETDIKNATPFKMHRISRFTFCCLCMCIPIGIIWTLNIFHDHDNCDSLTYWTAFSVSILYLCWMALMVSVCLLGCCMVGASRVAKQVTSVKQKKQQRTSANVQTA